MGRIRDPLVLAYETLKQAIREVHGRNFAVYDDFPNANEFRKMERNAANITYLSGGIEKGLMREFVPHGVRKNTDRTYTVATETCRMDYIMQVSFFANKKGTAERLSTEFMAFVEKQNRLRLKDDEWNEEMEISLIEPPYPPHGGADLWQCDQAWRCRGKLITESVANDIAAENFRPRVRNM